MADFVITITQPADGGSGDGLQIIEVTITPDFNGSLFFTQPDVHGAYLMERVSGGASGVWQYLWNTDESAPGTIQIVVDSLVGALPTGVGPTGFQVTGAWGLKTPADNSPITFTALDDSIIDMQAQGVGLGDGFSTMDLVPVTEFGVAAGAGVGTGVGTLVSAFELSASGAGVGTATGVLDILHDMLSGFGLGVGVTTGLFELIPIDMPDAAGVGLGTGFAVDLDVIYAFSDAAGLGVGTGFANLDLFGVIWDDPQDGVDNDPWDSAEWEVFVQVGGSVTATATIQSNRGELTNDTVNAGGAFHEAKNPVAPDVKLNVDVTTITDATVLSRQEVFIQTAGGNDTDGVPNNGFGLLIEDPAGAGGLQVTPFKHILGAATALSTPLDVSGLTQPVRTQLAISGDIWAYKVWGFDEAEPADATDIGVDPAVGLLIDGKVWVNTYSGGQADFRWDNWVLELLPFAEMRAVGQGVGTAVGTFTLSEAEFAGSGLGVGTGTGNFERIFVELPFAVGTGIGIGFGFLDQVSELLAANGLGVGTGFAKWRTGVYEGGDANPDVGVPSVGVDVGVPGAATQNEPALVGAGGPKRPYRAKATGGLSRVKVSNKPAKVKKSDG